ncbi:PHO85 cyclin-7 [Nannizzia gypsea CBS 118893]|uniref:PHO85 cyclin-7 n=1 Tax=Arthroderma gypseum (strain ATCC MYA-4604 / CBS 118893) TaxID=535722 RepID=E4UVK9_ARTGP|nr:PHO85 cyclin-7 [Nannizzia gypsea CBS 118893]EFR02336.1 PHO85 cyclin-7 [Nannizzia gypsea CBS 118893]
MGAVACAPLQPPLIASSSGGQQHRRDTSSSNASASMLSAGLKRESAASQPAPAAAASSPAASSSASASASAPGAAASTAVESAPASMTAGFHHPHQQQQHQQHASTTSLPSTTIHQRLPDRQRTNGYEIHSQPAFRPASGESTPAAAAPAATSIPTAASTSPSSPTRIKVRDLAHIQSFASEEALAGSSQHRPGGLQRQYEISSMPVADVIEMVAGLLTKITTTNDLQHEHLHRHIPRAEQRSLPPQTTSVLAFHGKNVPGITILNYLSRIHKYCPTTYEVFISLLVYFDRMTETVNSHLLQQMHRRAHLRPNPNPSIRTMSTSSSNRPHTSSSSPFFSPANPPASRRRLSSRRSTETSIARTAAGKQNHQNLHNNQQQQHLPTSPSVDHPMRSPSVQDEHDQEPEHDLSDSDDDLSDVSDELNFSHFLVVDSYNIHRLVIAGVTCASKFFSDVFYTNSRYAKVGGLPLIELNHLELQFLLLNDFRLAVPVEELEAYGTMLVQFYARELVAQQQQQQQQGTPQPSSHATTTSAMQNHGDPTAQNDRFTPTHT